MKKITEAELSKRVNSLREKLVLENNSAVDEAWYDPSSWGKPDYQATTAQQGKKSQRNYAMALQQIKDLYNKAEVSYPPKDDIVRQRYGLPPELPPFDQWDGKMPNAEQADYLTRNLFGRGASADAQTQNTANQSAAQKKIQTDAAVDAKVEELKKAVTSLLALIKTRDAKTGAGVVPANMPVAEAMRRLRNLIAEAEDAGSDPLLQDSKVVDTLGPTIIQAIQQYSPYSSSSPYKDNLTRMMYNKYAGDIISKVNNGETKQDIIKWAESTIPWTTVDGRSDLAWIRPTLDAAKQESGQQAPGKYDQLNKDLDAVAPTQNFAQDTAARTDANQPGGAPTPQPGLPASVPGSVSDITKQVASSAATSKPGEPPQAQSAATAPTATAPVATDKPGLIKQCQTLMAEIEKLEGSDHDPETVEALKNAQAAIDQAAKTPDEPKPADDTKVHPGDQEDADTGASIRQNAQAAREKEIGDNQDREDQEGGQVTVPPAVSGDPAQDVYGNHIPISSTQTVTPAPANQSFGQAFRAARNAQMKKDPKNPGGGRFTWDGKPGVTFTTELDTEKVPKAPTAPAVPAVPTTPAPEPSQYIKRLPGDLKVKEAVTYADDQTLARIVSLSRR